MFVANLKTSNIRIKEFEFPADIIAEVANIISSNDLEKGITGFDEDETVVFLEVRYDKGCSMGNWGCQNIKRSKRYMKRLLKPCELL